MSLHRRQQLLYIAKGGLLLRRHLEHSPRVGPHRRQPGDLHRADAAVVLFQQLALGGYEPAPLGGIHRRRRHPLRHTDHQLVRIGAVDGHPLHIGQLGAYACGDPPPGQGDEVVPKLDAGGINDLFRRVAYIALHLDGVHPEKDHAGGDDRRGNEQHGHHLIQPAEAAPAAAGPAVPALSCHGGHLHSLLRSRNGAPPAGAAFCLFRK